MNKDMLYQMVVGGLSQIENPTKGQIEDIVTGTASIPLFSAVTNAEIVEVRNKVLSERSVVLEIGSCVQAENYKYKKWFLSKKSELDMHYWERYRKYLIHDKGFPTNVVNQMDNILDSLTDLLGNPCVDEEFQRKGLIVGDVQSGKTSNYNGLICKAADAGYKVIVILTGTIESLRKQTQMRMDEGFAGIDSAQFMKDKEISKLTKVGVSKYNDNVRPCSLTSTYSDFKAINAKNLNFDIKDINTPVLFVLKKNVTTLKNINKWLLQSTRNGEEQINNSLVLIDDEADNASVNTKDIESDPTTINKQIRELLVKFKKSSYVGFTATPFANIFIDPETTEEMKNDDLFPRDFIYSLNPPSNYIGARDIFNKKGKHNRMLRIIDEDALEDVLPLKHKKDDILVMLPADLKEAICTFLLANVIRDLRGDNKAHRSMLVNMSRFTNVQESINTEIDEYLKDIQRAVKLYSKSERPLKNKYIQELKLVFDKNYSDIEFTWSDIINSLNKSIASVVTRVVNQKNKESLDYEDYEDGFRVIAIGGLSLSRGLTLEGLIISYFYRNSKMYDTLMQMGRWFGYRSKYEDLCRIWMTKEAISWYEYVSEATDELRVDIKRYEDSGLTPLAFGLRVRSDVNTLLVTARNKMRSASDREFNVTLSAKAIETPYIYTDKQKNEENREVLNQTIRELREKGIQKIEEEKRNIYKNINKKEIISLLENLDIPIANSHFDTGSLVKFIKQYKGNELENWDISFATGKGKDLNDYIVGEIINPVQRKCNLSDSGSLIKLNKSRLGTSLDGKIGLDENELNAMKIEFEKTKAIQKKVVGESRKEMVQDDYYRGIRNPLLLVYVIEPNGEKDSYMSDEKFLGFGIGIPLLEDVDTRYVKYKVNKVQQRLFEEDGIWDVAEEDEMSEE
ncbi:MAG: Z1 domain-containing protein [Sarcina sp.]